MGKANEIKEVAKIYFNKAQKKLKSAKILLKEGQIEDSISRSYYAAFLAIKALLILLGSDVSTHKGAIMMFNLKAIKTGLLPKELGKYLAELFDARQSSDYSPITFYDEVDAESFIKKAEIILNKIKNFTKEKLNVDL
ncbi:MAG: HEPN domain-containing protein [Candidatus Asgardarchaeia archaeon]